MRVIIKLTEAEWERFAAAASPGDVPEWMRQAAHAALRGNGSPLARSSIALRRERLELERKAAARSTVAPPPNTIDRSPNERPRRLKDLK